VFRNVNSRIYIYSWSHSSTISRNYRNRDTTAAMRRGCRVTDRFTWWYDHTNKRERTDSCLDFWQVSHDRLSRYHPLILEIESTFTTIARRNLRPRGTISLEASKSSFLSRNGSKELNVALIKSYSIRLTINPLLLFSISIYFWNKQHWE